MNKSKILTSLRSKSFLIVLVPAFLILGLQTIFTAAGLPPASGKKLALLVSNTPRPAAPVKQTAKVKFSSAYTKLDAKTCRPVTKDAPEDAEVPEICKGYQDYRIYLSSHGVVTRIIVGREIKADPDSWGTEGLPSFVADQAGNGQVIEWRLANGEPFACIVRAQYDKKLIDPDAKGLVNELIVKNLKGFAAIDKTVTAGKSSSANIEARRLADAAYLENRK